MPPFLYAMMYIRKKASSQRQHNALGMFCWETLGAGFHVDVTLIPTTYLNIVADQVHPLMQLIMAVAFFQ